MPEPLDVKAQITAMLGRGWVWSPSDPDLLVHPANHGLAVRYNWAQGTLSVSPELEAALGRVIPTRKTQSPNFWRGTRRTARR